jgi:hypothetical protein
MMKNEKKGKRQRCFMIYKVYQKCEVIHVATFLASRLIVKPYLSRGLFRGQSTHSSRVGCAFHTCQSYTMYLLSLSRDVFHDGSVVNISSFGVVLDVVALELDELVEAEFAKSLTFT